MWSEHHKILVFKLNGNAASDFREVIIRPGSFQDGVKLVQKYSCASNLACLCTLTLTRHPVDSAG